MQTIQSVYPWGYVIPEGFEYVDFRPPTKEDQFIAADCKRPDSGILTGWDWPSVYRVIVRPVPAPPPCPKTVYDVYGTGAPTIPESCQVLGFRVPEKDELYLSTIDAQRGGKTFTKNSLGIVKGPRLILKFHPKPPKTVRVVRVLEYVGPEEWIETTMKNSFINKVGVSVTNWGDLSITPGAYAATCRELSSFKEEVK